MAAALPDPFSSGVSVQMMWVNLGMEELELILDPSCTSEEHRCAELIGSAQVIPLTEEPSLGWPYSAYITFLRLQSYLYYSTVYHAVVLFYIIPGS